MVHETHCSVCGDIDDITIEEKAITSEKKEDISFATLLALVPAMTMTVFSLMGLM